MHMYSSGMLECDLGGVGMVWEVGRVPRYLRRGAAPQAVRRYLVEGAARDSSATPAQSVAPPREL